MDILKSVLQFLNQNAVQPVEKAGSLLLNGQQYQSPIPQNQIVTPRQIADAQFQQQAIKQGMTQDAKGVWHGVVGTAADNPVQQALQMLGGKGAVKAKAAGNDSPKTNYTPDQLQAVLQKGLQKYNPNAPIATMAAQLAQAGQNLPDQLLPAIIAMKETSGGVNMQKNNMINTLDTNGNAIPYPNSQTSLTGGMGQQGLKGLMQNSSYYQQYLKSGDLNDFFAHYTPASDPRNASYQSQINTYNQLRSNFVEK